MRLFLIIAIVIFYSSSAYSLEIFGGSIYTDQGTVILDKIVVYYTEDGHAKKQIFSYDDMNVVESYENDGYYTDTREIWIANGNAKLIITTNITYFDDMTRISIKPIIIKYLPVQAQIDIIIPGVYGNRLFVSDEIIKNSIDITDNYWYSFYRYSSDFLGCFGIMGDKGILVFSNTSPILAQTYDDGVIWRDLKLKYYLSDNIILYILSANKVNENQSCTLKNTYKHSKRYNVVHNYVTSPSFRGNAIIRIKSKIKRNLKITIYKQDLNIYDGADIVNITILPPDGTNMNIVIPDDGYKIGSRVLGQIQKETIYAGNSEGIYTLIIRGSSDVIIRRVEASADAMIVDTPILLYSRDPVYFRVGNITKFNISLKNPWNSQKVIIDSGIKMREIIVNKTNIWKSYEIHVDKSEINRAWSIYASGKLQIKFDGVPGYISTNADALFDPISIGKHDIPPLRGSYTLYFTAKDGFITVYKFDLNCYQGRDILNLTLEYPNGKSEKYFIQDDGYDDSGCIRIKSQKLDVKLPNEYGIYKLKISASGDMVVAGIDLPPDSKYVISGIYLPYTRQVAYFKPDLDLINISWQNPWSDQQLILRYNNTVIRNFTLYRTKSWKTYSINIPDGLYGDIIEMEVSGPTKLRFRGLKYISFNITTWFNPERRTMNLTELFIRGRQLIYYANVINSHAKIIIRKIDLNVYDGSDEANISLISPSGDIYKTTIPDDGISEPLNKIGSPIVREIKLNESGLYHIIAYNNEDVIISVDIYGGNMVYAGQIIPYSSLPLYFIANDGDVVDISVMTKWRNTLPNMITIYSPEEKPIYKINITETDVWYSIRINVNESGVWKLVPNNSPYILRISGILPFLGFNRDEIFNPLEITVENRIILILTILLIFSMGVLLVWRLKIW